MCIQSNWPTGQWSGGCVYGDRLHVPGRLLTILEGYMMAVAEGANEACAMGQRDVLFMVRRLSWSYTRCHTERAWHFLSKGRGMWWRYALGTFSRSQGGICLLSGRSDRDTGGEPSCVCNPGRLWYAGGTSTEPSDWE